MNWYGLTENGVIVCVVNWEDRYGEPTFGDFDYVPAGGRFYDTPGLFYDIVPVTVELLEE